jgi:hypothetical protein
MLSRFFDALSKNAKKKDAPPLKSPRPLATPQSFKRNSVAISIDEAPPAFSRYTEAISPSQFEYSDEPLLRLVLSNPTLHTMISEFAASELSLENVKCWDCK